MLLRDTILHYACVCILTPLRQSSAISATGLEILAKRTEQWRALRMSLARPRHTQHFLSNRRCLVLDTTTNNNNNNGNNDNDDNDIISINTNVN